MTRDDFERLRPHQRAFVETVERDPKGSVRILAAPPGMGKISTQVALIHRHVRRDDQACLLVLTDWPDVFLQGLETTATAPTVLLTKREWREWRVHHPDVERDGFRGVVLISTRVAQDEAVERAILATPWQLVVMDEAHRLGRGNDLPWSVHAKNPTVKVVLVSHVVIPVPRWDAARTTRVTEWAVRAVDAQRAWQAIPYTPSAEEAAFRVALEERFIAPLRQGGWHAEADFVDALTDSSLYAVETLLRRLRPFRNRLVHSGPEDGRSAVQEAFVVLHDSAKEEGFELGHGAHQEAQLDTGWGFWEMALSSALQLTEMLDTVTQDTKFETLTVVLAQGDATSTAVYTSFQKTASYLRLALREGDGVFDGTNPPQLVVTGEAEAALAGQTWDRIVHYDLPLRHELPLRLLDLKGGPIQVALVSTLKTPPLPLFRGALQVEVVEF